MQDVITLLGIESSCDETAASVVQSDGTILSNVIHSQIDMHAPYGGVVPEIASRAHHDVIIPTIEQALQEANMTLSALDGIAVTSGPGLIGGVIVGVMAAKGLALSANLPLLGINHLEAHALTPRLTNEVPFPYMLLLVSGGHCQLLVAEALGKYTLLGQTIDDAFGEAFDKVAKMLGLGYPGGPKIEALATEGNPDAYAFPRPLCKQPGCDFSLSGLKTAVLRAIEAADDKTSIAPDIAASFQQACADIILNRLGHAFALRPELARLVIAGGVAANQYLLGKITEMATGHNKQVIAPPMKLCTDNAAMIAWAGIEHYQNDRINDGLSINARPRWPL